MHQLLMVQWWSSSSTSSSSITGEMDGYATTRGWAGVGGSKRLMPVHSRSMRPAPHLITNWPSTDICSSAAAHPCLHFLVAFSREISIRWERIVQQCLLTEPAMWMLETLSAVHCHSSCGLHLPRHTLPVSLSFSTVGWFTCYNT